MKKVKDGLQVHLGGGPRGHRWEVWASADGPLLGQGEADTPQEAHNAAKIIWLKALKGTHDATEDVDRGGAALDEG